MSEWPGRVRCHDFLIAGVSVASLSCATRSGSKRGVPEEVQFDHSSGQTRPASLSASSLSVTSRKAGQVL